MTGLPVAVVALPLEDDEEHDEVVLRENPIVAGQYYPPGSAAELVVLDGHGSARVSPSSSLPRRGSRTPVSDPDEAQAVALLRPSGRSPEPRRFASHSLASV